MTVNGSLEREELRHVERVPAAERHVAYLAPERALRQRNPAPAALTTKQAAFPH